MVSFYRPAVFPRGAVRRKDGSDDALINRTVLHVVGILRWSWWRWLWTVLLRDVRGATPKRRDAVGASPVRSLVRAHVGTHTGNAATTATAAAAATGTGSRPRRALTAVEARAHPAAHRGTARWRTSRRRHVNTTC